MRFLRNIRNKQMEKIFCISFQRTGTTSVAEFFRKNGFKVVDWSFDRYEWTRACFDGDYERIFQSKKFQEFQVFEDHPWFYLDFYKILYHRFPKAKFILFTRDPDRWFDSLAHLFNQMQEVKISYRFFKTYGLEDEYYKIIGNNKLKELPRLLIPEKLRSKYIYAYNLRNMEVLEFFNQHDPSRLVHLELEDKQKWKKLGYFFKIRENKALDVHENKSTKK